MLLGSQAPHLRLVEVLSQQTVLAVQSNRQRPDGGAALIVGSDQGHLPRTLVYRELGRIAPPSVPFFYQATRSSALTLRIDGPNGRGETSERHRGELSGQSSDTELLRQGEFFGSSYQR